MNAHALLQVTEVEFFRAPRWDRKLGLLGWVKFILNGSLMIEGVAVRRTQAGALMLSFPEPVDRQGQRQRTVWPVSAGARQAIEEQVLRALRERGKLVP